MKSLEGKTFIAYKYFPSHHHLGAPSTVASQVKKMAFSIRLVLELTQIGLSLFKISNNECEIPTFLTSNHLIMKRWFDSVVPPPTSSNNAPQTSSANNRIVGISLKFSSEGRPVLLSFCVGQNCLIVQLSQSHEVLTTLADFFNSNVTFVGLGIERDVGPLHQHTGLMMRDRRELQSLAGPRIRTIHPDRVRISHLAHEELGIRMASGEEMTGWNRPNLTHRMVKQAALEALVSFRIGSRKKEEEANFHSFVGQGISAVDLDKKNTCDVLIYQNRFQRIYLVSARKLSRLFSSCTTLRVFICRLTKQLDFVRWNPANCQPK